MLYAPKKKKNFKFLFQIFRTSLHFIVRAKRDSKFKGKKKEKMQREISRRRKKIGGKSGGNRLYLFSICRLNYLEFPKAEKPDWTSRLVFN